MVLSNPVSILLIENKNLFPVWPIEFCVKNFLGICKLCIGFPRKQFKGFSVSDLASWGFIRILLPDVFSDWILKVDWFWLGDIVVSETDFSSNRSFSPKSVEIPSIGFSTPPRMALAAGISFSVVLLRRPGSYRQVPAEQSAYSDRTFDSAFGTIPRSSHPKMKGIIHRFLFHPHHQQTIGFFITRGLMISSKESYRKSHVFQKSSKIPKPIEPCLRENLRIGSWLQSKGTMIGPNPQTTLISFQIFNQGQKSFLDPFQLFGILKIAVFPDFKFLPVSIITRIDTDFFEKFAYRQPTGDWSGYLQSKFDSFLRHPSAHLESHLTLCGWGWWCGSFHRKHDAEP